MARLADDSGYNFRLCRKDGRTVLPTEYGFDLRSVTTIIDNVIAKPFGAGAWYGWRMGIKDVAGLDASSMDADALEVHLKSQGLDPNSSVRKDADRGSDAHSVLEYLAKGLPEIAQRLADKEKEERGTQYGQAVLAWWADVGSTFDRSALSSETPVWSLRNSYAGTLDLLADECVIDLKTHKPAAGFTKPGFGPAYLSDIVQARAYRTALHEMGQVTTSNKIVIARSNGKYLEDDREVPEEFWLRVLELDRMKLEFEKGEK